MPNQNSADVVIVGTGVVGCLISEQMLDAGLSVLMLEAGPRVERWQIVENFRNLPPSQHLDFNAPFPPKRWAPHLEAATNA
jgi:choline dehydrogenase-like flavoprotein